MITRFLSTVSPAPAGFEHVSITKRLLMGGPVALVTDDPERDRLKFAGFADRVQGILLILDGNVRLRQVGPFLWEFGVSSALWPHLRDLAEQNLALLGQTITSEENIGAYLRQAERAANDLSQLRGDYHRVALALQTQLAKLTRAQQALRESESRLRSVIESTEEVVTIKDTTGRYLLVNPAAAASLGHSHANIIGRPSADFVSPEAHARILETDRQVLANGNSITFEEADAPGAGGTVRSWLTSKFPFRDPDGQIVGIVSVSRDISDYKRAEQRRLEMEVREQRALAEQLDVRRQLEQLKELNHLKTNFVNAVSHDLRTPLTTIMGYAEFLEDEIGGTLAADQTEFVQQILKAGRRLEHLMNDLLDFARMEAGTFTLQFISGELGQTIQSIVDSLRPMANEAGLRLAVDPAEAALTIRMDPQRIEQVLTNLLHNAIKFTPQGGRIEVRSRADGNHVRCEVEDTGPGIAPEDVSRLFQRFSQLGLGLEKGGTGLGLSISKSIIESHGGEIGVESRPGAGSVFWFRLPLETKRRSTRGKSSLKA